MHAKSPLHRVSKPSIVDSLAYNLSTLTGTRFEVLREKRVYSAKYPTSVVTRYFLRATHRGGEGYQHIFGGSRGLTVNEMKYYLASLMDLIVMGFVPVSKTQVFVRRHGNVPR